MSTERNFPGSLHDPFITRFRLISTQFGQGRSASQHYQRKVNEALQRRKWETVMSLYQKSLEDSNELWQSTFAVDEELKKWPVLGSLSRLIFSAENEILIRQLLEKHPDWEAAYRLVVPLCVHVSQLQRTAPDSIQWQTLSKKEMNDPRSIVHGAHACTL